MTIRRVPILVSPRELTLDALLAMPLIPFEDDWRGNPPLAETAFLLAIDPRALSFCARCAQPPDFDPSAKQGEFKERLWERDVAEFFLCEDGSSRYQEFNVSPSGAWWTCLFDGYRKPAAEKILPPRGVQCVGTADQGGWAAAISIPRKELAVNIRLDSSSRANVCAIINGRARQFLSVAKFSVPEPDFHLADGFPHLEPRLSV